MWGVEDCIGGGLTSTLKTIAVPEHKAKPHKHYNDVEEAMLEHFARLCLRQAGLNLPLILSLLEKTYLQEAPIQTIRTRVTMLR